MTSLTRLSIRESSDLLRARELSASELLDATLARIELTEPRVHAYASVLEDAARAAAKRADAELARGDVRSPLHGIPICVKDMFYTVDGPTEAGSRVLAGFRPQFDATAVRLLREAGAVIVGKTVTHEFAWGHNDIPTRNAWNAAHYSGGSSAGSGVAVAAGSAFAALGTDGGGSVRNPAALNGVVGLKPTFGRVSRYGVIPMCPSLDHVGSVTRSVDDCALVLRAIASFDPQDAASIDSDVPLNTGALTSGVRDLRLGLEQDYFFYDGVADDVRSTVYEAIDEFGRQGASVVEVRIPELQFMLATWLSIVLVEASTYHRPLLREMSERYEPGTRFMCELAQLIPGEHYVTAQRARRVLIDGVKQAFDSHQIDALITPTAPCTAVPVSEITFGLAAETDDAKSPITGHQTFPANVTGQPALTVPCGFGRNGLPIGLQLIGRPFEEEMLFRIGHAYELATSWHDAYPDEPSLTGAMAEPGPPAATES